MDKRFLLFPIGIFIALFIVEIGLEYRHLKRGYNPPLFKLLPSSPISTGAAADETAESGVDAPTSDEPAFGPTSSFPFTSPVVPLQKSAGTIRIWMASSSHALIGASKHELFPNRLCAILNEHKTPCEMLNASLMGNDIPGNTKLVAKKADAYKPDYVLLYQMSNDITSLTKHLLESKSTAFAHLKTNPLIDVAPVSKAIEYTSAYGHLREYVSGSIALQAPLSDSVNATMIERFHNELIQFIGACRAIGATPVLITFASSHERNNLDQMPYYTKLTLMRYQQALSVNGWIAAVETFNNVIRNTARDEGVPLVDLEKVMGGRTEMYRDFVHFNAVGHEFAANALYQNLAATLNHVAQNTGS